MNNALYDSYKDLCIDRGVFPRSHKQLSSMTPDQWAGYVIELIREKPSRAERVITHVQDDTEPFRKQGDI